MTGTNEIIRLRLTTHQANKPKPTRPILRILRFWYEWLEGLILLIALYTLVNLTTARFVVQGVSMQANFESGQFLIVGRSHYILGQPQRGDIIVFHRPLATQTDYIKRIIALPFEAVEIRDTEVYIDGHLLLEPYIYEPCLPAHCADGFWQLGEDEYFVMGDNRNHSSDSRAFGSIRYDLIVGEALIRYWPVSDLAWIHQIGLTDD